MKLEKLALSVGGSSVEHRRMHQTWRRAPEILIIIISVSHQLDQGETILAGWRLLHLFQD